MSEEIKLYKLPPPKVDPAPQNLIFQARFQGFLKPIFIGWHSNGQLIFHCEPDLLTNEAVRMLEQAKFQVMGIKV